MDDSHYGEADPSNPVVWGVIGKNSDGRKGLKHFYWCPGCDALHSISIRPHTNDSGAGWSWDNPPDMSAPSYSPSQLSTWNNGQQQCVCHTFIKGGRMEFLGDCTHALKGQIVPLPPLPDWFVSQFDD